MTQQEFDVRITLIIISCINFHIFINWKYWCLHVTDLKNERGPRRIENIFIHENAQRQLLTTEMFASHISSDM